MEKATATKYYEKSSIRFLPFINSPASSYDTIYTSLLYVLEQQTGSNQTWLPPLDVVHGEHWVYHER